LNKKVSKNSKGFFFKSKIGENNSKVFDNFIGSYSFYKILKNGTINLRLVRTLIKFFSFGNPFKEFLTLNLKIYT